MSSYISVGCIFFAASFTQGVSGFGSALVAMPLLLFFLDAKTAVPLCMLNGLLITGFLSWQLKHYMDWRKIVPLCLGSLPGIYVGAVFLKQADDGLIRMLLGVMLVGYSIYSLLARPRSKTIHPGWSYIAGFGTGVIGTAFSAGGPPTVIYTTLTDWNKDDIKATLSGFFFITGVWIAGAHLATGLTTLPVLRYFAATALSVMFGVWTGSILYGKISKGIYVRVMLILLLFMGIVMIGTVV